MCKLRSNNCRVHARANPWLHELVCLQPVWQYTSTDDYMAARAEKMLSLFASSWLLSLCSLVLVGYCQYYNRSFKTAMHEVTYRLYYQWLYRAVFTFKVS